MIFASLLTFIPFSQTRDLLFQISFPSGAQVTVTNSGNRGLNIYITAPEDDYGATQGLCGTFDGRIDNDLTDKNGHVNRWSTRPKSFVESWR